MSARRILFPSIPEARSVPRIPKTASSHLGTAFELVTLNLLSRHPYNMKLIRVGGANDKGVDLRGRWDRPESTLSPSLPSPSSSFRRLTRPLDIIVQCKAEKSPLKPSTMREFEGVLQNQFHQNRNAPPPLGILVSLNGFSKQTMKRSVESEWPLSLVHLRVERERLKLDDRGRLRKWEENSEIDGIVELEPSEEVVSWSSNQSWKEVVENWNG